MTALFLVILINQWREQSNHLPALIGVLGSIVCLLLFGPDRFLPPAMGLILLLFTLLKSRWSKRGRKFEKNFINALLCFQESILFQILAASHP